LKSGDVQRARIMVGADGRKSLCRAAAGIALDEHRYPQVALTLCLSHARPHRNTSTEFHTASGPFTLVPLPGNRSSLVWVLDPGAADELAAYDDTELGHAVENASHSILGKVRIESSRGLFPLLAAVARRFADKRIVLVGEAAHVLPPIGAQGLNLGLRDAATIAELIVAARRYGHDIGGADLLARYDHMRRADVGSRTLAVDLLNRALLSDLLALQGARGLGLYLLDRVGPLRRAVMREGIAPAFAQPRLMRGEAL
jgi:2-octaprenyl-6-methoxyphenol hydroxylase